LNLKSRKFKPSGLASKILLLSFCVFTADDFKPASVDTNRDSKVLVGEDGAVTVEVPHIQVKLLQTDRLYDVATTVNIMP